MMYVFLFMFKFKFSFYLNLKEFKKYIVSFARVLYMQIQFNNKIFYYIYYFYSFVSSIHISRHSSLKFYIYIKIIENGME